MPEVPGTVVRLKMREHTNEIFYPLYKNHSRYLVLYGGAGSGKSVFAAQKTIRRMITEKGHKFLVVRKVAKTLRHSTFALLRGVISDWQLQKIFEINKTEMEITCMNGNKIIHAGLDDVEKIKSIYGITGIWVEEASELEQQDLQQLDLRLRGQTDHYKQIILAFNPVSITHWLKGYFFDDPRDNVTTCKSTYKDNRFIDEEYIKTLENLKGKDDYYYTVYSLGEWGVLGKTIFNAQIVTNRLLQVRDRESLKKGFFIYEYVSEKIVDSSIRWIEAEDGYIDIYEDRQDFYPYVIGGDTAGDGSDYFAGQVIDNTTGNQIAVLHHQFDEDLYAKQMYCLGRYYNDALIAIETNYSTYPVRELSRLGYHRQYVREVPDTFTGKLQKKYGFQTTKLTRPVIIANGVELVREHPEVLNHPGTLEEMLTFVRNEKGRAEAQQGSHDDLLMAWLIGHNARDQQSYVAEAIREANISMLPRDLQEDLLSDPDALAHWMSTR